MDPTCRWTLTPGSRRPSPAGLLNGLRKPIMNPDGWLRPPIGYGASGEHESFSGTVSIGTVGSAAVAGGIRPVGREAGRARLVFVNGHGGNVEALAAAAALLRYEGRDVGWCSCGVRERRCPRRPHRNVCIATYFAGRRAVSTSGRRETALRWPSCCPRCVSGGMAAVSDVGVLGDPTTATASDGERLFAEMVDGCSAGSRGGRPTATGC